MAKTSVKRTAHEAGTSKATIAGAGVNMTMYDDINDSIDKIAKAEKITKVELAGVSRKIVQYNTVDGNPDIATLNRLIGVLTPMNKATALLFFKHFVPHNLTDDVFGKRVKDEKKLQEIVDRAKKFLADENNNIWTWAEDNLEVEKKAFDLKQSVTRAIELAVQGKEESKKTLAAEPLSPLEILESVMAGGLTLQDMAEYLEAQATEAEQSIAA